MHRRVLGARRASPSPSRPGGSEVGARGWARQASPLRDTGFFVTFEGPEGSGKSTQVAMLREAPEFEDALLLREPGGTALGEAIRSLLLHQDFPVAPEAEMLLFMAARAQLLASEIVPALAHGRTVIADRYHDSTLAYQGGGRGLETWWPANFPKPDLTFLLQLPVELGLERAGWRQADRIESESLDFHRAVAAAYDRLAAADPERFVRLDATRPTEEIAELVQSRLLERKGKARSS